MFKFVGQTFLVFSPSIKTAIFDFQDGIYVLKQVLLIESQLSA